MQGTPKASFKRWWMVTAGLFVPFLWASYWVYQDSGLVHAPTKSYYLGAWFFTAFAFSAATSWAGQELFRPLRTERVAAFTSTEGRAYRRAEDNAIAQEELNRGWAVQMKKNLDAARQRDRNE